MTTIAPRLEELEATLADQGKVTALLRDGKFGDFVKDYAQAKAEAHTDLATQVQEETQRVLAQWLKDNGAPKGRVNLDPAKSGPTNTSRGKGTLYNQAAPGAAIDRSGQAPADTAEFFQAIWDKARTLPNGDELAAKTTEWRKIQNSFGSTVPADGGFLIPEEVRSEILQVALEESIVRSRATVIPMSSLAVPIPMIDDTSHASSVFGGIVAYWTEEGAAATESQAKFGRARLEAKKLTIYCEAPNELVADAPAFGALLDQQLPQATAYYEDAAFIDGSGVGEPLGFLNGSALVSVTRATADLIAWADVVSMYSRMLPSSLSRAVWLTSPDSLPQLFQMTVPVKNVAGTENVGGSAVYITDAQGSPQMQLLGRPLIVSEKIPKLTDPNALVFADLSYYLLGDRQTMQATSSPHFKFSSDVTAYKIVERVDGRPWLQSALTPRNGSTNTLSPFVGLST